MSFADQVSTPSTARYSRRLEDEIPPEKQDDFWQGMRAFAAKPERERKTWTEMAEIIQAEFGLSCTPARFQRCFRRLSQEGRLEH